jgi:hypothetical protein
MWLPKDERKLLEGYYVNIGEVEKEKWFDIRDWITVIKTTRVKDNARKMKGYFESGKKTDEDDRLDPTDPVKSMKRWLEYKNRVDIANAALEARKLIKLHKHQSKSDVKAVILTIEGYDLGRKYSSWWTRSGLLFAEYKNHWIWLIVSFLGGIIGGLFINWLS